VLRGRSLWGIRCGIGSCGSGVVVLWWTLGVDIGVVVNDVEVNGVVVNGVVGNGVLVNGVLLGVLL
jgi:hypothetical protein